jgi:hypothetical protein
MRTYLPYRIEQVGTFTRGGFDYRAERHYPHGGSQYMVIVYRKDRVHERGLAFRDEAHFRVCGARTSCLCNKTCSHEWENSSPFRKHLKIFPFSKHQNARCHSYNFYATM